MSIFTEVPFLLAFTGGLVATVNPCGFAMLPAYLSFFLGLSETGSTADKANAVGQALRVGTLVAAGFVLVFGAAGLLLTLGAQALTSTLPWAALVVGTGVAALGGWLLSGRSLPVHLPTPGRAAQGRSNSAVFVFGVGYAIASLSCTLPVFLAVVAGTVTRQSPGSAVAVFGVYALGMALPLLAVTVALAVGRDALLRRARAFGRHANVIAGFLLVVAGAYIVLFWAIELAGITGSPIVSVVLVVERTSSRLTTLIGEQPVLWGALFALVVALAIGHRVRRRSHSADRASSPSAEQEAAPLSSDSPTD